MESFWLIFLLVGIFFSIVGQVFRLYFNYNVYENDGFVKIKIWFITLKQFSFQIKKEGIVIRTKKRKKSLEYSFSDPKLKFYENLTKGLKEKVKLKYLNIYSKIGTGDAHQTAILSGVINIVSKVFSSYLKNIKPTCTFDITPYTDFKNKVCEFYFFSKLSLSIFDFLYCLMYAVILKIQNT